MTKKTKPKKDTTQKPIVFGHHDPVVLDAGTSYKMGCSVVGGRYVVEFAGYKDADKKIKVSYHDNEQNRTVALRRSELPPQVQVLFQQELLRLRDAFRDAE